MELLMKTFEEHKENLRYLLRYEDLRKNTITELQKVYQFLEIEVDKETLTEIVNKYSFENIPQEEKGKREFRRFATPGMWKENFNEDEKMLINGIVKDTLKKLGY